MRYNLQDRMKKLKMSQSDLATKLNVSRSLVSHWLAGRKTPSAEMTSKLFEALGLVYDPMQLLEIDESDSKSKTQSKRTKGYKQNAPVRKRT